MPRFTKEKIVQIRSDNDIYSIVFKFKSNNGFCTLENPRLLIVYDTTFIYDLHNTLDIIYVNCQHSLSSV